MNILITGNHGFVGNNMISLLKDTHVIYGLDIIGTEQEGVIKTYSWNDMEYNNIPPVDVIIHLAGKAHDVKNSFEPNLYFEINTELTKKIFDYFLDSDAERFIFFSSVKAAADKVECGNLTEDVIPKPVGPYGESKILAEKYILEKAAITEGCQKEKKKIYIIRPSMIHGPGNKGNLNLLYNVVKKGIPWPLGGFENQRSFTSIDNISYVVERLLHLEVASGIYHMSDDNAVSTNELIQIMCYAMGKKANIWKLKPGFIRGLAHIGTLLHLPLNQERLIKLTENYVVSNDKIKNALGIDKLPVTAKDGLVKTIKSFTAE